VLDFVAVHGREFRDLDSKGTLRRDCFGTLRRKSASQRHGGHRGEERGGSGLIRFGKRVVFLGVEQVSFVRKETGSGTFNPKLHTIRFAGLPAVFASGEGWRTDAAKPG